MRIILEENQKNVIGMDLFSKLIQNRIIFIDDIIDDVMANEVIVQLLYLDSVETSEITIYINSPGGIISQGLAIFDISRRLKSPIRTICIGEAASMAAVLMLMGQVRCGLKHSRFMLHQANTGVRGKLSDVYIEFEEAKKLQSFIYDILKEYVTIPDFEEYMKKDNWLGSIEAKEIGLITDIL